MEFIFWFFVFMVAYTYFGYPLILIVLAKCIKPQSIDKADIVPMVTIIIAAHNEEKAIGKTIENKFSLDYPSDKLEILIVSDASTDRTNEIVLGYKDRGVMLEVLDKRGGKLKALNSAVPKAKGEIIVFTDANTIFRGDNIKKLVRNFNDPDVVCVNGEKQMMSQDSMVGEGENSYWKYDSFVREVESKTGSLIAADGSNLALRKDVYPFPERGDISDDVAIVWELMAKGYKSIYEPEAIAYEKPCSTIGDEFHRKTRIISWGFAAIKEMKSLLNPLGKNGSWLRSWKIFSHRVFKWIVPYFLILIFISNLFMLNICFYKYLLAFQLIFYSCGLIGYVQQKQGINSKVFLIPFYFIFANVAAVCGFFKFICKRREAVWESPPR